MSEVKAAMTDGSLSAAEFGQQMDDLRAKAMEAGARTAFSASEAALGITELGKAGISSAHILSGALDGALDLAAADSMEVADAAELMATTLNQFGLAGTKAAHVADLLAAGAGKAQGSAADLGYALSQVGGLAHQMGFEIEEVTGALTLFASKGMTGEKAGTALRGIFTSLSAPTKEASDALKQYNIEVRNGDGSMKSLAEISEELHTKLGGLDAATRDAAMSQIFNVQQLQAANYLYEGGAEAVEEYTDAINQAGFAQEQAATKMDNLAGDWENLTGSVETALIQMGSADGPLRSLVQTVTNLVNAFSSLPPPVQQTIGLIVGGSGLVTLGVVGFMKLTKFVKETKGALETLGVSMKTATLAAGGIGLGLAAIAGIISLVTANSAAAQERVAALKDTLTETADSTEETARAMISAWQKQQSWWSGLDGERRSVLELGEAFGFTATELVAMAMGTEEGTAALAQLKEEAASSVNGALNDLINGIDEQAAAFNGATEAKQADIDAAKAASEAQQDLGLATGDTADAAELLADAEDASAQATALAEQSAEDAAKAYEDYAKVMEELFDTLVAVGEVQLSLRDAQRGLEAAIDDATDALRESAGVTDEMIDKQGNLTAQGQALVDQYVVTGAVLDETTEKGRANQAALDDIASAAFDLVESMKATGATGSEMAAAMSNGRDQFIAMAEAMGLPQEEAAALADQLGLIPTRFELYVDATTDPARGALSAVVTEINGASGSVTIRGDNSTTFATLSDTTASIDAAAGTITITSEDTGAQETLTDFTRTVDESTGAVTITGNDADGRTVTYTFTSWADSQTSTITVDAYTDDAEAAIAALTAPRSMTVTVNEVQGTKVGRAGGGPVGLGLLGLAFGGRVPGPTPANRNMDNALAQVAGRGLIGLQGGEFVQKTAAVEHYGLGTMWAINDLRIPKDVLRGYAGGGQVESYAIPARSYAAAAQSMTVTAVIPPGTTILIDPDQMRDMLAASKQGASATAITALATQARTLEALRQTRPRVS
jgi:TP901 family phage tail tape measure protein